MRVPICQYSVVSAAFTAADSVSILARPEGRALRQGGNQTGKNTQFQSSPVPKDGRYAIVYLQDSIFLSFQSSPVPKDGRYISRQIRHSPSRRFNPRPSRRTGATPMGP